MRGEPSPLLKCGERGGGRELGDVGIDDGDVGVWHPGRISEVVHNGAYTYSFAFCEA